VAHIWEPVIWELCGPFFNNLFLRKTRKRNGVGRPKWTKINVQFSKVPEEFCKGPLGKTRCDHFALFPNFP
jgi:hypothetical protein